MHVNNYASKIYDSLNIIGFAIAPIVGLVIYFIIYSYFPKTEKNLQYYIGKIGLILFALAIVALTAIFFNVLFSDTVSIIEKLILVILFISFISIIIVLPWYNARRNKKIIKSKRKHYKKRP